jgi:transketolase
MIDLCYVPAPEVARARQVPIAPEVRAALFAAVSRLNTLYMIARAGSGHIGTSFSSIDIISWLFLEELRLPGASDVERRTWDVARQTTSDIRRPTSDAPADVFFSSKGHDVPALYAVLIGLGLLDFDLLHQLRRLGGLPGHPDVSTPFIATNTGSLGMGISKARGMVLANRLLGRRGDVYVLTGDGELQEGQFWESLQPTANQALGEITVIVDHNKVQSDTFVAKVSDLGNLEQKLASFGWLVARCDGNDVAAFSQTLRELKTTTDRPKIVVADTVKGKGVSFMEHTAMRPDDRLYRFHSGAPDAETYIRAVEELVATANRMLRQARAGELRLERLPFPDRAVPSSAQRLVGAYSRALVEQAERNPRIVALDADLALDCGLLPFEERFPERFIECGIAEQDMVSQAGGLALRGMLPIVHSFACFLSTRPNEQIYNNATEKTKIVYVGSLAGLVPGGPGHSHQSVRDISALTAVPGLTLLEPCSEAEVTLAVDYCFNRTQQSCYLRLESIPCQIPYELPADYRLERGRGVALTDGSDAVMFGYGPVLLTQAYHAAGLLAARGIGLKVVNLPWLNWVDPAWLREIVAGYARLFTVDNHYLIGGQGELLLSQLAQLGLSQPPQAYQLGVREIPACGTNEEVLQAHDLDAEGLCETIAGALSGAQPPVELARDASPQR